MPSDQQVSARAVLDAVMELRRAGPTQTLQQLEQIEPDLASYLMETLSDIHRQLLALGGPAKQSRCVYRAVQDMALTCIAALRRGHYELWRQSDAGSRLDPKDAQAHDAQRREPNAPTLGGDDPNPAE